MAELLDAAALGTGTADRPADLLRVEICPNCGYSLAGLNDEGVCPECGSRYGRDEILLQGVGRGDHAGFSRSRRWAEAAWLASGLWNLTALVEFGLRVYFWVMICWIAAQLALAVLTRATNSARMRACPAGCLQDNSHEWSPVLTVLYLLLGTCGLCFWVGYAISPWAGFCTALVPLAVAWMLWRNDRIFRRECRAEAPETNEAVASHGQTGVRGAWVPWAQVNDVDISYVQRGGKICCRIRISRSATLLKRRRDVVDFETPLTRPQVEEFARRVKAWALAAREASGSGPMSSG